MARKPSDPTGEPATRVFHARELQEHLRRVERDDEPSTQAKTRFFRRAGEPLMRFGVKTPAAETPALAHHADVTVAALDAASFRAAAPRLGNAPPRAASVHTEPIGAQPEPALTGPRRVKPRVLVLSALAALAVGFVAFSSGARSSQAGTPYVVAQAAPVARRAEPTAAVREPAVLSGMEPSEGATRRALDALLEGRTRDALDQYRALSLARPGDGAFSQIVRLLEHELSGCRPGETACP